MKSSSTDSLRRQCDPLLKLSLENVLANERISSPPKWLFEGKIDEMLTERRLVAGTLIGTIRAVESCDSEEHLERGEWLWIMLALSRDRIQKGTCRIFSPIW